MVTRATTVGVVTVMLVVVGAGWVTVSGTTAGEMIFEPEPVPAGIVTVSASRAGTGEPP